MRRCVAVLAVAAVLLALVPAAGGADVYAASAKKPAKVTGVDAAGTGYDTVTLTWSKAARATKYQVYRSTSKSKGYKKVGTVTGTTYKSTGLKLGTTYYFKVRALNGKKAGAYSAIRTGRSALGVPAVKARSAASGPVLTWSAVKGATGYIIYKADAPSSEGSDTAADHGHAGSAEPEYIEIGRTTSCRYTDRSTWEIGRVGSYKVAAYASVKDKTYYWNSKSKKWVTKKPASKYYKACNKAGDPNKGKKTYTSYKQISGTESTAVTAARLDPAEDTGSGIPDMGYAGEHGRLSVEGTELVDAHGEPVQLRGMSTHGLAWFPQYVKRDTLAWLRDDWNVNCIRLAMYTEEYGGYCNSNNDKGSIAKNQAYLKSLVRSGVDYATDLGLYVIIDWHILSDGNPLTHKAEAVKFFDEMSGLYGEQDNVLYEICNEPNGGTSWADVKKYAEAVIPVIRANDPDAVILVGSPTWSQDIDKAAAAPLGYDNIMYTLHFYAATHTDWLRQRMEQCIRNGLPVFVSEFGTCDASGSGSVDKAQAEKWKSLIEKYNVSYMCWNLSNKNETSSVIKAGCKKTYGWTDSELSEQGRWIRAWFRSEG